MNFKLQTGFTLIETMVAVTILTISIVGPMFTASRAIVAAQISRDQLTASYLAQEGIEYIRAVRDEEHLILHPGNTDNAWANFLTSSISQCNATSDPLQACTLDPHSASPLAPCSIGSCASMNLTPLVGGAVGYTQQSGTPTSFVRTIQLVDVTSSDKRIVSRVSWNFHGTTYVVRITDHLTPWQ